MSLKNVLAALAQPTDEHQNLTVGDLAKAEAAKMRLHSQVVARLQAKGKADALAKLSGHFVLSDGLCARTLDTQENVTDAVTALDALRADIIDELQQALNATNRFDPMVTGVSASHLLAYKKGVLPLTLRVEFLQKLADEVNLLKKKL